MDLEYKQLHKDLYRASRDNDWETVKRIIEQSKSDEKINLDHGLYGASSNPDIEMTILLVRHGANVNGIPHPHIDIGNSPILSSAISFHNVEVVKYLVLNGVTEERINRSLWVALTHKKPEIITFLIDYCTAETVRENFLYLLRQKLVALIPMFVERGADLHTNDDEALICACLYGQYDIVKYLIEKGADVHARKDDALRSASRHGHESVIKLLIESGIDIRANNASFQSLCRYGSGDLIEFLLDHGAIVDKIAFQNAHDSYNYDVMGIMLRYFETMPVVCDWRFESKAIELYKRGYWHNDFKKIPYINRRFNALIRLLGREAYALLGERGPYAKILKDYFTS